MRFWNVRTTVLALAGTVLLTGAPGGLSAQDALHIGTAAVASAPRAVAAYPEFRAAREATLLGVSAALFVAGHLIGNDHPVVPPRGFDPGRLSLSVDRGVVGNGNLDAHLVSNWTRNAALVLPFAAALLSGRSDDDRWEGFRRRGAVITEAFAVSQGVTFFGKEAFGRARPYTYVSDAARVKDPSYDVTSGSAFASMPSGHSSSAWTGAALAMTEYLLSHPDEGWLPRSGVGLIGGALAGATSALRVEAGQHFPSDVLVGAGIGIITGVAVPLMHRGGQRSPSAGAWLEATGGAATGALIGILFARRY